MLEIRRILCPVDFSDASRHALDHAVMIAGWYRARIVALHVRHPAFLIEPPILFAEPAVQVDTIDDVETRLQQWVSPVRAAGIDCDVLTVEGANTAARIVQHVATLEADLIVMGTHGRSGFERLLLGSVAERVVRTAPCPVVTVPPPSVVTSKLPFRRLLCGIDFSEPSLAALRFALSIARESKSTLTVMHVIEFPPDQDRLVNLPFDLAAFRTAVREDATRRLMELVADGDAEACHVVTELGHGRPYEQLLAAAGEGHADLIVLGVHGRNAFDLALFGSTTTQVIRRATCPVLTLNV
jgi:nucleotide-binding universal stress UspA family protein